MDELLQHAGLNDLQAQTYLYLLDNGESSPPAIAEAMNLTRSNAYKILDKLVDMNLIDRAEVNKKFMYRAADPVVLTRLIANQKLRIVTLEKGLRQSMPDLRRKYQQNTRSNEIDVHNGNEAVASLYKQHTGTRKPTYSLLSTAKNPNTYLNSAGKLHQQLGLAELDYTAPVEWSVSGDELLIISFEEEASAVRIKNLVIATAFRELWQLLDNSIRRNPDYKKLPKQAKRKV